MKPLWLLSAFNLKRTVTFWSLTSYCLCTCYDQTRRMFLPTLDSLNEYVCELLVQKKRSMTNSDEIQI